MSSKGRSLVIALAVAAAVAVGFLAIGYRSEHPSTNDAYVQANIVRIVPQVSGRIVDLAVRDNQVVQAGDVLFEIDPRPFQIAVDSARAQLDKAGQNVSAQVDSVTSAEASLDRARAGLRLAEVQFERIVPLAKQGALPAQDRDKAQAQLDGARSGLRSSEARLAKARDQLGDVGEKNVDTRIAMAALENAQLQLEYTKVVAPVDGFVTQLQLSIGSYAQAGSPLLSLVNGDSWRVVAYFREDRLSGIEPGQGAKVHLPAYPHLELAGVVQGVGWGIEQEDGQLSEDGLPSVSPTVDWVRLAQRFPVRITLASPDADHPLRKGMSATVRIDKSDVGGPPPSTER